MSRDAEKAEARRRSVPRACGDEPMKLGRIRAQAERSPRMRG